MLTPAQQELLVCLMDIQTNGPYDMVRGICDNTDISCRKRGACMSLRDDVYDELENLFRGFGLCGPYPVGGGDFTHNRALYQNTVDMWDANTKYGLQRWALLDRCIKHLTELERQ